MNNLIISEFKKLIQYIKLELDDSKRKKDKELIIINTFRLKNITKALYIIKKLQYEITLNTFNKDFKLPGIGKGTINRITEILNTGKLSELNNFKYNNYKENIIKELETIVGIGRSNALDLYNNGIISIKDLKKKIKNKTIKVSDKIKLGIKYYNKFFGNIPRNETTQIKIFLKNIIKEYNIKNNLNKNNKFIIKICGSYRRKKSTSNDIDLLISKKNTTINNKTNYLKKIIKILKNKCIENNNKKFLIDDITDKNYKTKYMGFCKYKNNLIRRIDIRFVTFNYYYSALMYFTGSAEFNKKLRIIAKNKGYKLSEYGLINIKTNENINITSEKDIFNFLNLEYIKPINR